MARTCNYCLWAGHLTNMQGCHGNCTGGLYVSAEYHGEGTSIMQIQPKGNIGIAWGNFYWLLYNTSGKNHFHEMNGDVGMARWK